MNYIFKTQNKYKTNHGSYTKSFNIILKFGLYKSKQQQIFSTYSISSFLDRQTNITNYVVV